MATEPQKSKTKGAIVAGCLAPHPPHLVYAENPPQNEPRSECGWETLRWAYESMRNELSSIDHDVLVILSPHWRTYVGTHILATPQLKSLSVDPVFPHLFRYSYDIKVDVELAETIHAVCQEKNIPTKLMQNPDFRVDYGTIVTGHMINPLWNKPIVCLSANSVSAYYNLDRMQALMMELGAATKEAIEKSGRKAILLASHSLSHRHFTSENEIPEDMSKEHITNHSLYLWDMKMINLMKAGKSKEMVDLIPDFTEQTNAETESGGLTWMMQAMDYPTYPAKVHGYGTVIGTGNVVASWAPKSTQVAPTAHSTESGVQLGTK
jgi:2-aminophenol/2-amino-5-chlorophenol 1,6-dioxygenase beta subunit